MFLSNPSKLCLLIISFVLLFAACGSSVTDANKPFTLNTESNSEFPFSTKEPDLYQGDFVVNNGFRENKWFVARKGKNWRFDTFLGDKLSHSQVYVDTLYLLDHGRKVMASDPSAAASSVPGNFNATSWGLFDGKEYREFEKINSENGQTKYRVNGAGNAGQEILVVVDNATGIVVKQEFNTSIQSSENGTNYNFVFEVRNLKTEVDDAIFDIPTGYKKVSLDEFQRLSKKKTDE